VSDIVTLSPRVQQALRWLSHLPLGVFRLVGAAMGAFLFVLARRRRRIVLRNLALCFPQASAGQRLRWAWQTFKHFGQSFVDRVWVWHGAPDLLTQRVQLTGDVAALLDASPVLLFVPHFYGMDAGWARLTQHIERPWWTFYSPQSRPAMDAWVRQGRQRFGAPRLVPRHEGVRPLVKGLRDGAALCLLPDMDLGRRDSVFVPFFGVQAATVTSLPRLAKVAGVPVRPWVCRIVPGGYRVEVMDAWEGYPTGDDAADARTMNERLEAMVRTMPGQYHWLHRRFKSRPEGEPNLYRR
jgi:Kdo2-lipid IVA lauroyltransferase/acyltransferase